MVRYLGLRLLASIPVLLIASFAVFCLVAVSGDPLADLREQSGVSEATIQARAEALHLDDSLLERYGYWISGALRGDFGVALDGEAVTDKLARSAGVTLRMVVVAAVVAVILAIAVGVGSALREGSLADHSATLTVFVCFSMPVFFLAGVLKDLAIRVNEATGYRIFATVGERGVEDVTGFWVILGDRVSHLILPTAALVLVTFAAWSRYQRASMLEVLGSDFLRTARAKGASERRVVLRHGLRNALIPLTTVVAVDFAMLLNGSIVVETIFAWNGLGRLFIESLQTGDVNVSSAWLLIAAGSVVAFNLLADLVYAVLDPRIRHAA